MNLFIKLLIALYLFTYYIRSELPVEELLVLQDLSDEWGVSIENCSSYGIECCNNNSTVCKMYV